MAQQVKSLRLLLRRPHSGREVLDESTSRLNYSRKLRAEQVIRSGRVILDPEC